MQKRKPRGKKRRYRPISNRNLSNSDLVILDFLWTWKVATSPMLGLVGYKGKSNWWVYKALRRLRKEKYIQVLPKGKSLKQELWALTELGFEVVLMDRDDISAYRYKPHAPTHDFLATCLQLGDLWLSSSVQKQFFTEQMLASLAPINFPRGMKKVSEHIPDGITLLQGPLTKAYIGYEVDINLKDKESYANTFKYYEEGLEPHMVIWLVRNTWMAQKIFNLYKESYHFRDEKLMEKVAFVLLDDFKINIWNAKIINKSFKDISIRKAHANLVQSLTKKPPKWQQKEMSGIYFPKYKSPQKLNTYQHSTRPTIDQHPTGPG